MIMAKCRWRLHIYLLCLAAIFFVCCDSRKSANRHLIRTGSAEHLKKNSDKMMRFSSPVRDFLNAFLMNRVRVEANMPLDDSSNSNGNGNTQPYGVSSPFFLPPYNSLPPIPLPENAPPFCVYPPFTPQPPSTTVPTPTPTGGAYSPPPASIVPIEYPPPPPYVVIPNPPIGSVPSPNTPVPTTPPSYSPPTTSPSPPTGGGGGNIPVSPSPPISYEPSPPTGFVPSPPVFFPPTVYPAPSVPPPPRVAPAMALWCVAKPSVPDPIIQEAMNYACASGADCDQIQASGSCFQPNTLLAHASYAFNSYWQRTKVAGGTCEFGGIAMLVTVDPSYDGCQFIYL